MIEEKIMLTRIITSLVAVCVLVPVLLFSGTAVLPIGIGIFTVIAVYEMLKCMGHHKRLLFSIPLYAFSLAIPFALRYIHNGAVVGKLCFVAAAAYLMIVFVCVIWSHGALGFADALSMFAACAYIITAMNSILFVRDFGESGKYIYLLIFLGAWITDIFAYFTGVFFGKHKLIEDVSPKKTVEGSIGGIFFCVLSFVIFGIVVDAITGGGANLIFLAVSGLIASLISQVGDLIMSVIKRHYGVKDYGKLFPGHGGVLDRFDSVLAVSLGMAAICMIASVLNIQFI